MFRLICLLSAFLCLYASAQNDIIIIGQVLSSADGTPVENAKVSFLGTSISTTTNEEGYFYLPSPVAQKSVAVEILGYKKKVIKLNQKQKDQMLEIILNEDINILNEVIISSTKDIIKKILHEFNKNREKNSPENLYGLSVDEENITKIYLTNISKKIIEKKIFSELKKGILQERDSSLILPIYFSLKTDRLTILEHKINRQTLDENTKTIDILTNQHTTEILNNYCPKINFYKNHISLLGKIFPSPTAKIGLLFYNYSVRDTIFPDNSAVYIIKFYPKNNKDLAFVGQMMIDAKTFALIDINAVVQSSANLNFIKNISSEQNFQKRDKIYFYNTTTQAVNFVYNFSLTKERNYLSAILYQKHNYHNITSNGDSIMAKTPEIETQTTDSSLRFVAAIDSLNRTKLQKIIYTTSDILINGYVHIGKVDLGIIYNFIRVNPLEGFRPTFSFRTNEKLCRNLSFGGYFGYGFKDKDWKYGGNLQFIFGDKQQHLLGGFFDNEVYRLGYNQKYLLNENMISGGENLMTSFSWGQNYNHLMKNRTLSMLYSYEKEGLKLSVLPSITENYPNQYVEFLSLNKQLGKITVASLSSSARFSFKEKYIEGFLRRFYLPTTSPIITLMAEIGYYKTEEISDKYGKLTLAFKHNLPFLFGKISYSIYGVKIFGAVPYILLQQPLTMQGIWYNNHNFDLINQMEFLSDIYASLFFRYYSNGVIFNNIPYIKSLNLRETFFVNMAWGDLSQRHASIMNLPATNSLRTPYIEMGAGITNILKFISIESVWRLTHRDPQNAIKWGIRIKFYLDF